MDHNLAKPSHPHMYHGTPSAWETGGDGVNHFQQSNCIQEAAEKVALREARIEDINMLDRRLNNNAHRNRNNSHHHQTQGVGSVGLMGQQVPKAEESQDVQKTSEFSGNNGGENTNSMSDIPTLDPRIDALKQYVEQGIFIRQVASKRREHSETGPMLSPEIPQPQVHPTAAKSGDGFLLYYVNDGRKQDAESWSDYRIRQLLCTQNMGLEHREKPVARPDKHYVKGGGFTQQRTLIKNAMKKEVDERNHKGKMNPNDSAYDVEYVKKFRADKEGRQARNRLRREAALNILNDHLKSKGVLPHPPMDDPEDSGDDEYDWELTGPIWVVAKAKEEAGPRNSNRQGMKYKMSGKKANRDGKSMDDLGFQNVPAPYCMECKESRQRLKCDRPARVPHRCTRCERKGLPCSDIWVAQRLGGEMDEKTQREASQLSASLTSSVAGPTSQRQPSPFSEYMGRSPNGRSKRPCQHEVISEDEHRYGGTDSLKKRKPNTMVASNDDGEWIGGSFRMTGFDPSYGPLPASSVAQNLPESLSGLPLMYDFDPTARAMDVNQWSQQYAWPWNEASGTPHCGLYDGEASSQVSTLGFQAYVTHTSGRMASSMQSQWPQMGCEYVSQAMHRRGFAGSGYAPTAGEYSGSVASHQDPNSNNPIMHTSIYQQPVNNTSQLFSIKEKVDEIVGTGGTRSSPSTRRSDSSSYVLSGSVKSNTHPHSAPVSQEEVRCKHPKPGPISDEIEHPELDSSYGDYPTKQDEETSYEYPEPGPPSDDNGYYPPPAFSYSN